MPISYAETLRLNSLKYPRYADSCAESLYSPNRGTIRRVLGALLGCVVFWGILWAALVLAGVE